MTFKYTITYIENGIQHERNGIYTGTQYDSKEEFINDLKSVYPNIQIIEYTIDDVTFNSSTGQDINANPKTPETADDIQTSTEPNVNYSADNNSSDIETYAGLLDDVVNSFQAHAAWDPRLYRIDEYFINNQKSVLRIPFASQTAATAFADLSNVIEVGVVQAFIDHGDIKSDSELAKRYKDIKIKNESETSETNEQENNANMNYFSLNSDLDITNPTKDLENDSFNWGVQSIVNPYSLTKLMGGLELEGDNNIINYLYDIRDHRRFYGLSVDNGNDPLSVSNPTITQLIKWSNADQWGRTPYSFQDFVYCKYFGLIPNNRLITLRRYSVPTYDNLQFENMFGDQEKITTDANGNSIPEKNNEKTSDNNIGNKTFSPIASVVTWFGGDTGNSLNNLMSFSTGINWGEIESKIWNVTGDTGESKQSVIDKFLGDGDHAGLFPKAELDSLNSLNGPMSKLSAKITSLGKFNLALKGQAGGLSQEVYDKIAGANVDPFDTPFQNRIKGPVNRIDKVKKREPGIKFSQSLNIKCAYKAKAIGGINPKAALLDVLGNCLEMVSPHAVFWGGGHRFMIHPQIYPFHDGGWRDSFMKRIYDGKFLGDDGAIATVLSGFKKVGTNNSGEFSFDTAKNFLKDIGGGALSLLGQAIGSLSDIFGGNDFLNNISNGLTSAGGDRGAEVAGGLKKTLKGMWHNRMLAQTVLPTITAEGNILIGEPVGEWHLTVGNPLNPIMVIGNLICSEMKVNWDEEIGPDDFPEGFSVEYTLEHAMARDSDAIQSMFNRGMGKFYTLPDYVRLSSEQVTYVDKFTKNVDGATGTMKFKDPAPLMKQYGNGYQVYKIEPGSKNKMAGNYNTQLVTKFTPINTQATRSVADRQSGIAQRSENVISRIRSLAATRKLTSN